MPLSDFIEKGHKNLKEITSVRELPTKNPFILTVGASWCGHCKSEFKESLNPLCNEKSLRDKGTQCFGVDGTTDEGRQFVQDIGLPLNGYPTNIMCRPNKANSGMDCLPLEGFYPKKELQNVAKKMGIM